MVFSQNNVTSIIIEDKEYNIQSISFMGTEAEWNTNSDYIPKAGELVIYTPDEKISSYRLKIGDGTKRIVELTLNYIETAAEREELLRIIENHTNRIESTAKDITDLKEEFREIKNSFDEVVVEKEEIQAVVEEHTNKIENVTKDVVDLKQDFLDSENNFNNALSEKADIIQHAKGKLITLDNAGYTPVKGLKLYGKTTQFTTTGKNLLAKPFLPGIHNDTGYHNHGGAISTDGFFLKAGTYVLSGTINFDFVLFVNAMKDATHIDNTYQKYYTSRVFTIPSDGLYNIQLNRQDDTVLDDVILQALNDTAQVEFGETATAYEPYTGGIPAPNPDYPQELVSAGASGAINTTVAGKNLFPKASAGVVNKNGITFTSNGDGIYTVKGTATGSVYLRMPLEESVVLEKGMCVHCMNNADTDVSLVYDYSDGTSSYWVLSPINRISAPTKNFGKTITQIGINIQSGNTVDIKFSPMFVFSDKAMDFVPYQSIQTLTASTPNGLPGIPVSSGGNYTDENGQQWICDEIDFARGVYVQRIAKQTITNGSYVTSVTNDKGWLFNVSPLFNMIVGGISFSTEKILCNYFERVKTIWNDEGVGAVANQAYAIIGMPGYSLDEVKAWIEQKNADGNPLTFIYVLKTPIETALSDEELTAYAALHTNKPNTTVYNDAGVEMEIEYHTPNSAVPMSYGTANSGSVLGIDEHGCVVPVSREVINTHRHNVSFIDNAVSTEALAEALGGKADIIQHVSGELITLDDTAYTPVKGLKLFGKTTQNGTPTPENPVELVSAGASGAINTTVCGGNLCNPHDFNLTQYRIVDENGYINLSNNTEYNNYPFCIIKLPKGTYTVGIEIVSFTGGAAVYLGTNSFDYTKLYKSSRSVTFTDTNQISLMIAGRNGATMKVRFTVNVGNTALPYEPYKGQTLTASTPNGLPGIPLGATIPDVIKNSPVHMPGVWWDEETQQYYLSDTKDYARGVYVKRVHQETFAPSAMDKTPLTNTVKYGMQTKYESVGGHKSLCSVSSNYSYSASDTEHFYVDANVYFFVAHENVAAFEANESITLLYDLKTPVETPLPSEELAQYSALHTNKPNTTVYNDANAYMEMDYYTPTTAVQMVHSPADEGKVLSIDQHGCVVLTDLATRIAQIESQLAYMAIITNNEEMLEV